MMGKLTCDNCGSSMLDCRCTEAECRACGGNGWVAERRVLVGTGPVQLFEENCPECNGAGWIKCDRGGVDCPYRHCYCEAAWDRQQEDNASEPPMTANERHQRAYDERQALRAATGESPDDILRRLVR